MAFANLRVLAGVAQPVLTVLPYRLEHAKAPAAHLVVICKNQ